jgi:hypothetical protein
MKFTLIYDGDLPAGHSSRARYASQIRNHFHAQLRDLWHSNVVLRQLARTARTAPLHFGGGWYGGGPPMFSPVDLPTWDEEIPPLLNGQIDLCAPILKKDVGRFIPLVRNSLYLICELDILFLRHDEPFKLLKKGGDLDNRIKTLFDALRMPDAASELGGEVVADDPLYVLLEDDALINGFSVKSGKLLGVEKDRHHRVRLTIDVTVQVLRVREQNMCLLGC